MKLAKIRKYAILSLVLGMLISLFTGIIFFAPKAAALAEEVHYGDGSGDVYLISSAQDLYTLSQNPTDWGKNFKLTRDIDLSTVCYEGVSWTSIGNSTKGFTGTFDGDDHKISGLYIDSTAGWQGLFGYVDNGTIKNLKVEGTVIGNGYVGGIVGYLNIGTVEKCSFEGTVKGGSSSQAVGGIAGYNHFGTIKKCSNRGGVSCLSMYTGGIVGQNYGQDAIVIDCENTATISLTGSTGSCSTAGGIVGINLSSSKIINCSNTGKIGEGNNLIIGGIVGSNNGSSVTQCYNTGIVTGSDYIGGVAGRSKDKATITQCYNTGAVSGSQYIGGVAGQNDGATVMNCYNTATVTGSSNVGGLVGKNYEGSSKKPTLGTVKNCYNRGTVTGDNSGGVVGLNKINNSEGTVENCYYLTNTAVGGINNADTDGATVKTEAVFNSGEIAWLLQHGQDTQVWGQWLKGNEHEIEKYPVLTDQLPKRVWKASFIKNGEQIFTAYVNNEETLTPPAGDEWYDSDGNVFDSNVKVTKDMTLGLRVYFGGIAESTVTTVYGRQVETNLDELIEYENGSPTENKFDYTIIDNGGIGAAALSGNTLIIPNTVNVKEGGYTLKIRAHERTPLVDTEVRTFAARAVENFGEEDVILTVKVIINKAEQAPLIIKDLGAVVTYGDNFTLEASGGTSGEAIKWQVTSGNSFAEINEATGAVSIIGVGDVTVTATRPGGDNYYDITDTISFSVNKANQTPFTIKELPASVIYGSGNFQLETEGGWEYGTVTWEVIDGGAYVGIDKDTGEVTVKGACESVTVKATKSGGDNYYDISDTISFPIHKANQPAFTIKDLPSGVTYGSSVTLETDGGLEGGTVVWEVIEGGAFVGINAATGELEIKGACENVTIKATKSGGDNYYDISDTISFPINKANQPVFTIKDLPSGVTYGDSITLETVGGLEDSNITWEVVVGDAYIGINAKTGELEIKGACENVTIKATKSGGDNYYDISDTISFPIHKANQTAFRITDIPSAVAYGGEAFTLKTQGGWNGGTVAWAVTSGTAVAIGSSSGEVTIKGTGSVTITATKLGGDNYNDISDVITFTVHKANQPAFKITDIPNSVTYNDKPFTLKTSGGWDGGTVTWEVVEGDDFIKIDEATGEVTVKGACESVTVKATKLGGDNYYDISDTVTFTVNKANQEPLEITGLPENVINGNGFQLTTKGGSGTGKVTWEVTDGKQDATIDSDGNVQIKGAGSVTIVATKAGDDNYNATVAMINFTAGTANQAPVVIKGLPESVTYGDGSFELTADGGSGTGKITWDLTSGDAVSVNTNADTGKLTVTVVGAGDVIITVTKEGDEDYNSASAIITFTVNKANQGPFTIKNLPESIAYKDGFKLATDGGSGEGAITWNVSEGNGYATVTADGTINITGVGAVTVTATKADDGKYNAAFATISFTVHKANQDPFTIIDVPGVVTYEDKPFTLKTHGGSGEGAVAWAVTAGNLFAKVNASSGEVEITGVGEVTITATKASDENYNSASAIVTFTVHKANQSAFTIINLPDVITFKDTFTLKTQGGWDGGKVTWEVIEGTAAYMGESDGEVNIKGVGEVTIKATKSGGDNYNDISTIVSFTVIKANQTSLTVSGLPASVTFGDGQFELTASGGSSEEEITWEVIDGTAVEIKKNTLNTGKVTVNGAGTVTIMATMPGGDNYNDISTTITFTVNKANQPIFNILGLPLSVIYGGENFTLYTDGGWDGGTVTWQVTDGDCVTVDADGNVTISGVGTATITAIKLGGDNYNDISTIIVFNVEKGIPEYVIPEDLIAYYGNTLAEVQLPEGWAWDEEDTDVGAVGVRGFSATYTPDDTEVYNTVTLTLAVTVKKATPEYTVPAGLTATYGDTLADVPLPEGWTWIDALTTSVGNAGARTFFATFTPEDTQSYITVTIMLTVDVAKAIPEYTIPTGLKAVVGNTLANVKLPGGWAWKLPLITKVGKAGERKFVAIFTPSDTENYQKVSAVLTINVEKGSTDYWWIILIVLQSAVLLTLLILLYIQLRNKPQKEASATGNGAGQNPAEPSKEDDPPEENDGGN